MPPAPGDSSTTWARRMLAVGCTTAQVTEATSLRGSYVRRLRSQYAAHPYRAVDVVQASHGHAQDRDRDALIAAIKLHYSDDGRVCDSLDGLQALLTSLPPRHSSSSTSSTRTPTARMRIRPRCTSEPSSCSSGGSSPSSL